MAALLFVNAIIHSWQLQMRRNFYGEVKYILLYVLFYHHLCFWGNGLKSVCRRFTMGPT
jgi:hypothetical protein